MNQMLSAALASPAIAAIALSLAGGGGIERVGEFQSETLNRVLVFRAPSGLSPSRAAAYLATVDHSPGRLTYAVIYTSDDHPGPALADIGSYLQGVNLLNAPPFDHWAYGVAITPDAEVRMLL